MERRTFHRLGSALLVMSIVVIVVQYVVMILFQNLLATSWFSISLTAVFYIVGVPVFFLMVRRLPAATPETRPLTGVQFLGFYFVAMAATYVLNIVGSYVNAFLMSLVDVYGQDFNPVADLIDGTSLWLMMLFVCVLAPIFEELVFRKLLLDRLRPFGDRVAILYSGLAFGLYHMNFAQFFYAAGIGFVLGYLVLRTGKWWHGVLMHMAINITGSLLPTLLSQGLGDFANVIMLVFIGFVVVAGTVVLLQNRRKLQLNGPQYSFSERIGAGVVAGNVGTILYIMLGLGMCLLNTFAAALA